MRAFIQFNFTWILYVVFVLCCLALQNGLFGGGGNGGTGGGAPAQPAPGHAVSG